MSDSMARYTYGQIAAIKTAYPDEAAGWRRAYSMALRLLEDNPRSEQEQKVGMQIEDRWNELRRVGKIK